MSYATQEIAASLVRALELIQAQTDGLAVAEAWANICRQPCDELAADRLALNYAALYLNRELERVRDRIAEACAPWFERPTPIPLYRTGSVGNAKWRP